jgi:hypothetical protein
MVSLSLSLSLDAFKNLNESSSVSIRSTAYMSSKPTDSHSHVLSVCLEDFKIFELVKSCYLVESLQFVDRYLDDLSAAQISSKA